GLAARLLRLTGIGAIRNEANVEIQTNGLIGGRLNLNLPAVIAANSKFAIEQITARGFPSSRLYFLPNVVETELFKPEGQRDAKRIILLASGRVVKQKRFDRVISIVEKLRNNLKLDVRALIIGPVQDKILKVEL